MHSDSHPTLDLLIANPLLLRCVGDIQCSIANRAQIRLLLDILAKCPNLRTLFIEVGDSVVQSQMSEMFQSVERFGGTVTIEVQEPLPFLERVQLGKNASTLLLPSLLRQARNLTYLTFDSPSYQLSHPRHDMVDCGRSLRYLRLVGEDATGGLGMSQGSNVGTALKALRACPDYSLPSLVERATRLKRLDIGPNYTLNEPPWGELITNFRDALTTPNGHFIRELSVPRRFLRRAFRGGPAVQFQTTTKTTPLFDLQVDLADEDDPEFLHRALNMLLESLKDPGSCLLRLKRLVLVLSYRNTPRPSQRARHILHLPKELLELARKRRICIRIKDDKYSIPKSRYFDSSRSVDRAIINLDRDAHSQ